MNWEAINFPLLNASLNFTATVLLCIGFVFIRKGRVRAHKRTMLSAFAVSCLFLGCYIAYHFWPIGAAETLFPGIGVVRGVYLAILASHILLAVTVPFLAVITIVLGLTDRRSAHRKLARWTFPIWLYVSVTGVVIYLMLLTHGAYSDV
ncbi:MAG: DUF420 domain-containing protein [Planctomycetales bacterium]